MAPRDRAILTASLRDPETPAAELKGQGLHDALVAADLPTTGSAQEKRDRLAAHRGEA